MQTTDDSKSIQTHPHNKNMSCISASFRSFANDSIYIYYLYVNQLPNLGYRLSRRTVPTAFIFPRFSFSFPTLRNGSCFIVVGSMG